MGYEIEGDWFSLPKLWADLRQGLRDEIAALAGEIHTYDGGRLLMAYGKC